MTLIVNEENSERVKLAGMIKDNLDKAGFDILVVSLPYDQFESRLASRQFDMYIAGYNMSVYPELSFMFNSRNAVDGTNYSDYMDPAMDKLLSAAFSAGDAGRQAAITAVLNYISDNNVCVPIAFRVSAAASSSRLHAELTAWPGSLYDNINTWYLTS